MRKIRDQYKDLYKRPNIIQPKMDNWTWITDPDLHYRMNRKSYDSWFKWGLTTATEGLFGLLGKPAGKIAGNLAGDAFDVVTNWDQGKSANWNKVAMNQAKSLAKEGYKYWSAQTPKQDRFNPVNIKAEYDPIQYARGSADAWSVAPGLPSDWDNMDRMDRIANMNSWDENQLEYILENQRSRLGEFEKRWVRRNHGATIFDTPGRIDRQGPLAGPIIGYDGSVIPSQFSRIPVNEKAYVGMDHVGVLDDEEYEQWSMGFSDSPAYNAFENRNLGDMFTPVNMDPPAWSVRKPIRHKLVGLLEPEFKLNYEITGTGWTPKKGRHRWRDWINKSDRQLRSMFED